MSLRSNRATIGALASCILLLPVLAVAAPKPKPKPAAKPNPVAGKTAFTKEGCAGCHKTKDIEGGATGPDLSSIGKTHKAAQISAYITKPKAGSIMPAYKGPKKNLDDMTAYLLTQK